MLLQQGGEYDCERFLILTDFIGIPEEPKLDRSSLMGYPTLGISILRLFAR